jgi:SAM-dependent methyltransferase
MHASDALLHSAAAERNRQPILAVLQRWLPARGTALEIASGTGQHAIHFAAGLPAWAWQPTDADAASLASIAAWREASALANLQPPLRLDVMARPWPITTHFDAIFCANLLHIAPWPVCDALMQGAARHLEHDGQLILYGPFLIDGIATAPGNLAFDTDLRARNPAWGLRRLADLEIVATAAALTLQERVAMPANNEMLRFGPALRCPAIR